jgi:carbon-monoxide dehydrogenase small subunit
VPAGGDPPRRGFGQVALRDDGKALDVAECTDVVGAYPGVFEALAIERDPVVGVGDQPPQTLGAKPVRCADLIGVVSHAQKVVAGQAVGARTPGGIYLVQMTTKRPIPLVQLALMVNGETRVVSAPVHHTLLEVLREELGLTGTKHGCELGECGTCTVLVDGRPVLSCLAVPAALGGRAITTIEGMESASGLHPLQQTFAELGAAQCGYCTPGFLLAGKALLEETPAPTREEIVDALGGNLCRCTGYLKIYEAVELAAARMRGETAEPAQEILYGEI